MLYVCLKMDAVMMYVTLTTVIFKTQFVVLVKYVVVPVSIASF